MMEKELVIVQSKPQPVALAPSLLLYARKLAKQRYNPFENRLT